MSRDISNHDDVIDSRDVIARIEELEALRKPWVAGCNMPGYLPDSDPSRFDSWEDARDAIISDLEEALELAAYDEDGNLLAGDISEEATDLKSAIERLNDCTEVDATVDGWGETIGSWHYWITHDDSEHAFEDMADFEELQALKSLAEEAEGYADDWSYGAPLIRDSYFTEYAQELCEDCGDVSKDLPHYVVIDWEATARNIQQDYTSVEFDGVTYWVR